jgi:hypothetical protein
VTINAKSRTGANDESELTDGNRGDRRRRRGRGGRNASAVISGGARQVGGRGWMLPAILPTFRPIPATEGTGPWLCRRSPWRRGGGCDGEGGGGSREEAAAAAGSWDGDQGKDSGRVIAGRWFPCIAAAIKWRSRPGSQVPAAAIKEIRSRRGCPTAATGSRLGRFSVETDLGKTLLTFKMSVWNCYSAIEVTHRFNQRLRKFILDGT